MEKLGNADVDQPPEIYTTWRCGNCAEMPETTKERAFEARMARLWGFYIDAVDGRPLNDNEALGSWRDSNGDAKYWRDGVRRPVTRVDPWDWPQNRG